MPYIKDKFGNSVWVSGDDTSQQQERFAGMQQQKQQESVVPSTVAARAAAQKRVSKKAQTDGQSTGEISPEVNAFARAKQNYNIFKTTPPATSTPTTQQEGEDDSYRRTIINGATGKPIQEKKVQLNNGEPDTGIPSSLSPETPSTIVNNEVNLPKVKNVPKGKLQVSPGNESTAGMDYLNSLYTDPKEEERLRKASVMNQRILAVGDALRHIGNIANTVNYAPSQQFNRPWEEERQRYEKSKAIRDAANAKYYTYQQQKAAQEAQMKRLDAQIKKQETDSARNDRLAEARISRMNQQNAKDTAWQVYYETRARLLEEGASLEEANKKAQIALRTEQARLAKVKADQGGFSPNSGGGRGGMSGYTVETQEDYKPIAWDALGNPIKWKKISKKVRTPNRGSGGNDSNTNNQNTSNTPPSRQKNNSKDNNNVPPSRRR